MKTKILLISTLLFGLSAAGTASPKDSYRLSSPDNKNEVIISIKKNGSSAQLFWAIVSDKDTLLLPSKIAIQLSGGEVIGLNTSVLNTYKESVNQAIPSPLYKKHSVRDQYNQLTLRCKGNWGLIFRAYDDGVAYRFFSSRKEELTVMNETAEFNFPADHATLSAYVNARADNIFASSYQSTYVDTTLSGINPSKLVLLPALISSSAAKRVVITEADVENYPGLFLQKADRSFGFKAVFPPYPKGVMYHATRKQERIVSSENFIAKTAGTRLFPWRVVAIAASDASLLTSDLVYKLAPAPNPKLYPLIPVVTAQAAPQISWIKPGKVAWDWWNDWRISGVDFAAGINTKTYKYYIDFAANNGLEYVILDEGWSPPAQGNVMQVIPEINLQELADYAKEKNVGLILWVVWNVLDEKLEAACQHYATMGFKGFKIDFIDRADQKANEFISRASLTAAKYKMIVDFHGVGKPTGQNRTYPNALNFEGVYGLEELKWAKPDMPLYDVTYPFIRGLAGPADYTQGAMRNAAKDAFVISYREPMSQGTRCHQMGSYMIFDAPLAMLCDHPTAYMKEQECTDFIAQIPTVFDETVVVAAQLGEYIVMARRLGNEWFIGGLTNWTARELSLDLSFLPQGSYRADLFKDGVNAHRVGVDYKHSTFSLNIEPNKTPITLPVKMAPGGGFALRLTK